MTGTTAIWAFSIAAGLATMTPGLDTALILRTAAVEGKQRAGMAALGIAIGVLTWGSAAAFGLAELFRVSAIAYEILRWTGAAYLLYLGAGMLFRPRTSFVTTDSSASGALLSRRAWLARGLFTNLLNPKLGVFYLSFLPQFIPQGTENPRALMLLFAAIHATEAIVWFSALILATDHLAHVLRRGRIVKLMDQLMGTLLVGFGAKLAFERRG